MFCLVLIGTFLCMKMHERNEKKTTLWYFVTVCLSLVRITGTIQNSKKVLIHNEKEDPAV